MTSYLKYIISVQFLWSEVYHTCEVTSYLWNDKLPERPIIPVRWPAICMAYHTCVINYLWDKYIIPVRWRATWKAYHTCQVTSYLYGISYLWGDELPKRPIIPVRWQQYEHRSSGRWRCSCQSCSASETPASSPWCPSLESAVNNNTVYHLSDHAQQRRL